MSILSRSKARLRGSQPFPDPAFSFQPHGSFPLSSAATSFWCLWVWVGVFFFPVLALFQWSSRARSLSTCMSRTEHAVRRRRGWQGGTRGRAGVHAAAISQPGFGARADAPTAAAKPRWLCRGVYSFFCRRPSQANS